jgi:hypothetical protein
MPGGMKLRWLLWGGMLTGMGCGGSVGDDVSSSDAGASLCEARRRVFLNYTCAGSVPSPEYAQLVYEDCEQRMHEVAADCRPALERYFECINAAQAECDHEACEAEEGAYTRCVSGGTCEDIGGGRAWSAGDHPERAATFDSHEACACIEPWDGLAPGAVCRTWEECAPVCCACPGSSSKYTAAACDFARSADLSEGVCPTPDRVCALTSDRCP